MKSTEILKALKEIKSFKGVFSCNNLPDIHERTFSVVANTDPIYEPGTHWIGIYVENYNAEYFDPFGLPPLRKQFVSFLNIYDTWKYNTVTIQRIDSIKCGEFCIAFVKQRSSGVTFRMFISCFSTNNEINDEIVMKYVCNFFLQ